MEIPEISERYVWNTLSSLKKTATGPDQFSILLPKVDVPVARGDIRGINVTPVIARALEKAVYKIHAQRTVEEQLLAREDEGRERIPHTWASSNDSF